MTLTHCRPSRRPGLTLAGLAIVLGVAGVLAAVGVPRLIRKGEGLRASEAFAYLYSIKSAQERYQARSGTFAASLYDLDNETDPPKDFSVAEKFTPGSTGSLKDSWTLALTRKGISPWFGAYTVVFRETGFDAAASRFDTSLVDEVCLMGYE
ncbi:type IV pilin protein [Tundrisphaera lichenicola]|uniref:type IV pilin protein n=1 Tax=Tundrisphaera lichenicola TaxID=2029860 RepID=UPI003EC09913